MFRHCEPKLFGDEGSVLMRLKGDTNYLITILSLYFFIILQITKIILLTSFDEMFGVASVSELL